LSKALPALESRNEHDEKMLGAAMLGSQAIQHNASIAGYEIGVPEIYRFGYAQFQSAMSTSDDWAHHDGAEIVFLLGGEACWELEDNFLVPLAAGQCVLFSPALKHRITNGIYPPSSSFWMVMSPSSDGATASMLTQSNRMLFESALGQNGLTQKMTEQTIASINAAIRLMKDKRMYTGSPLLVSELRAHLHLIIVETWKAHELKEAHAAPDRLVKKALEQINADTGDNVKVADIAKQLGCTRGHLHTVFRRDIGMSPSDYIQRLRIKRACEVLLKVDASVTDIAYDMGFASSQHFARTFRKYLGLTPTVYRKQRSKRNA
jgi:AraC-like DNA-binding protein